MGIATSHIMTFMMAEVVGIPYYKIAIAAFLPALISFAALFFTVEKLSRGLASGEDSPAPAQGEKAESENTESQGENTADESLGITTFDEIIDKRTWYCWT